MSRPGAEHEPAANGDVRRPLRIALYGEVEMNFAEDDSRWVQSVARMLATLPWVELSVLLHAPEENDSLTGELHAHPRIQVIDPDSAGHGGPLDPAAAIEALTDLDGEMEFDFVLLRGRGVVETACRRASFSGRLWVCYAPPRRPQPGAEVDHLRLITSAAERVLCETEPVRALAQEVVPELGAKLILLPPTIAPVEAASTTEDRGRRDRALRLCYAGELGPDHCFLEMVEAFRRLHRVDPESEFHLVADELDDAPGDSGFRSAAEAALADTENLIWHRGLSLEERGELLRGADVALSIRHPMMDKELATNVLEYGAADCAVLLNRTPVYEELLGREYPLFAGDPGETTSALLRLREDPALRAEAARRCRTASGGHLFDRVAYRQVEPYLRHDAVNHLRAGIGAGVDASPAPEISESDVAELRRERRAEPLLPYEALMPEDQGSPVERLAERVMTEGWRLAGLPPVDLKPPIEWDEVCASNRSWHFHLHCWDGIGPLLSAYQSSGEMRFLGFAVSIAEDWLRSYPSTETDSPFAWYDMAVGLRAYRLGYILDAAARSDEFDDELVGLLLRGALMHREMLDDEENFAAHSNHGFYQAAGQLALAKRFPHLSGMGMSERQGLTRVRELIGRQFTEEGVHREHSPGYHLLVFGAFDRVLRSGLIVDRELWDLRDRIQEALAWFVLPNGKLAMFGDTSYSISRDSLRGIDNDALRFVTSAGAEGAPPDARLRAFPLGGYAVVRDRWPDGAEDFEDCSYLAQMCGFHSQAHKHADDLTLVWYDRGCELLSDAGRYGYEGRTAVGSELWKQGFWYSNPKRVYVESTRAHNTVEVDGQSHPRRDVKPYGSALRDWGSRDGISFVDSAVRYGRRLNQHRTVVFNPGHWLLVLDSLGSMLGRRHDFTQRFHFAPELEAERRGSALELQVPGSDDQLWMASLAPADLVEPVRGQEKPELLGWISREGGKMIPTWTSGYAVDGTSRHLFATLLAFGSEPPEPVSDEIELSGRKLSLGWRHSDGEHGIRISRGPGGQLEFSYSPPA